MFKRWHCGYSLEPPEPNPRAFIRCRNIPFLAAPPPHATILHMAKKTTLKEIGDMLAHVVKHMATKEDIADLRRELKADIARVQEQVTSIEAELRHGRYEVRLGNLEEKVFDAPHR